MISSGPALTRTVTRKQSARILSLVKAETDFGTITVTPSADGRVAVTAEIALGDQRLSTADRKRFLPGFTLVLHEGAGTLRPEVVPPADFPKHIGFGIAYRITAPSDVALTLSSENGAIRVEDTQTTQPIHAASSFGSITLRNAGKAIDASTENGAIDIASARPFTTVTASSSFGAVHVTGQADVIDAKTENGEVTIEGATRANTVRARSSFGAVTLTNCAGNIAAASENGTVRFSGSPRQLSLTSSFGAVDAAIADASELRAGTLSSENGSVTLALPSRASAAINAHTGNGSITTTGVPGTLAGEDFDRSFHGTMNGGKAPLHLTTDFGSITLRTH